MSQLFDKATQKFKKKVGQAVGRVRPSSRQDGPSAPSQQSEHSVGSASEMESHHSAMPAAASMAQLAIVPVAGSRPLPLSHLADRAADSASLVALEPGSPAIPAYAKPASPPTILATTGSAVKGLLVAARDGSDLFLPLKAALVGIVALWDVFDRNAEAKAEFAKLESKLVAFKAIADAHQLEPRKVDQSLQTRLVSISQAVQRLWEAVEQRQARGGVAQVAQSSIDIGDIKALFSAISSLLEVFQFESSIAVEKQLGLIVERIEEDRKERLMKENAKKQEKIMKTIMSVLGENFVSEAADYEQPSYAGCMTGTRVGVLSKFVAWVKNDPTFIFWLAGMAGTGKTSIAVSLCRMLRNDPAVVLGGGYFCSRSAGSIMRTDVRRILPTLAALLADQSQEFAQALAAELEKNRRVGHKPVVEQIDTLLRQPLAALASFPLPIIFIIDALDECSNERELAELLRLLADFECDAKVKFILTSRPEMYIRGTPISNPEHNTILQLHTISVDEVMSDIRLYITGTLEDAAPAAAWYTDHDIDALVVLCDGLFIFASTVLKYVLDPDEDEQRFDRLRRATSTVVKRSAATTAVDRIYELVLNDASRSDAVDEDELESMKRILICILKARESLSVEVLATLIEIKPSKLRASLRRLHSLVYLPKDDKQLGLRTLHASFGDYLLDRAPQQFRVAHTLGHDILARGCLKRLAREDLCFNVSRSRSSYESNPKMTAEWIPRCLVYACLHWAHHIDAASGRSAFDEDVGTAFRSKFLFWLEALSVLGKVGFASGLLRIAGSAVTLPVVSQFLRDANAFVASSYTAINRSAPHIYISALPFAAKDSLVYRDFMPICAGLVSVVNAGIDRHGGHLVTTLTGHEATVRSVAYSSDGCFVASGSDDGTLRIWDTRTGEETISPLRSNDGSVISVAFAPDGSRVASGVTSNAVHIWSTTIGREILPPLRGHTDAVRSVAFSRDGGLIASASSDKTVRLWSAGNGRQISVLIGHTDKINAVSFSPDSRLIASASKDKTVRLWNAETGQAVGNPLTHLEDAVLCLDFSSDGRWLAAGSRNTREIRIWDLVTREPTFVLIKNQTAVYSLAFSPDGSMIVCAGRRSIQSWNPRTGRSLPRLSLAGHSDWVNSVVFSPDGLFIASGSTDSTIRIWDAVGGVQSGVQPLQAHSGSVTSVTASHDGGLIISGSLDCSARVWDSATGEAKLQPLLGHRSSVLAVAVSSDGCLIASASADRTVRLWNAQTGEQVGEPLQDHEGEVNTVAFSPGARWLASGSDDKSVRVWDVATKQPALFGPLQCMGIVLAVVFSPDGRILATGDLIGYIHLWWSATGRQARTALHANTRGIYSINFSPNATQIASGASDGAIIIWDVEGGHQVCMLEGHIEPVRSIAYSPDGLYVSSASYDKTVRLWDAQTGLAISTLFGHGGWVRSVAFMPDGRSIVSGGIDQTIHAWDMEAAHNLRSRGDHDPLFRLGAAALDEDGWLVGPSGELLIWIPADYRGHILLPPCSMIIGSHRVVLNADGGMYWGDQWTACWGRNINSAPHS